MFWADSEGLDKIVDGLKRQEERMKPEFSFSRMLLEKAEKGEKFSR
jgi:3-hydroxyacyl-CoA dehydrogenase